VRTAADLREALRGGRGLEVVRGVEELKIDLEGGTR
jgi:hypothetical protein